MSFQKSNSTTDVRQGFTLIELLVVIGILLTVAVIVIPSVRTLNEDRKVRDTARIVGAVFSAARERAAVDGAAGVEIVSIASASGQYNVPNMGLVLYQLRAIPAYVGDAIGATVNIELPLVADSGGYVATFSMGNNPLSADVKIDDYIELNNSGNRYRILAVTATTVSIEMDVNNTNNRDASPLPPLGVDLPFKIHRQPVRIESGATRLPNNLFLNMAWSGYGTAETTLADAGGNEFAGRQFRDFNSTPPAGHPDAANYPNWDTSTPGPDGTQGRTRIWFAQDGSIDRVDSRGYYPAGPQYDVAFTERPTGPLYFLMCSGEGDDVDLTNLDSVNFLIDRNNIWISVDHRTGGVNINRPAQINQVLNATNTERTQVQDSRTLVRKRRGANP